MLPMIPVTPVRTDALSWIPYNAMVEASLCVKTKYDDLPVSMSIRKGDLLGVPRALCGEIGQDMRAEGTYVDINCTVPPRNETQMVLLKKAKALLDVEDSFVLQATTGFGKTYCASNLIAHVKTTTLVVVTKEDLMEQWRKELKKFLGLTDDEIGTAQQDQCDYKGKKVVLGMVHSLAKGKYGPEFAKYFGFVIFDEVHRMGAETFSQTCGMFPAKLRLGLSATVNRVDGKSFVFGSHIGPVRVKTELVSTPPKVLFRKTGFKPKTKLKIEPARMMGLYKQMAADQARNQIIVDFVVAAYKKGRRTIIFSDLKEAHLTPLHAMTRNAGVPADDMAFYVGGLSEKARALAKTKKVLWATYAMTAEATDIPQLDTAVLATPRANILQPVGRILREWPDKKEPVVLDLVDDFSNLLVQFMSKRRTQYFGLKANILNI